MNRYILCIIFLTVLRLGCLRKPSNPPLRLRNTPLLRNPHDQKWLFVFGTGRSGSTTLKNMLNQVPGIYIGGETNNLVGLLTTVMTTIFLSKREVRPHGPWGHYPFNDIKIKDAIRHTYVSYLGDTPDDLQYLGSKQLLNRHFKFWCDKCVWPGTKMRLNYQKTYLPDFVDDIEKLFPGAKIIMNWRATMSTFNASWANNRDGVMSYQPSNFSWTKNYHNTFGLPLEDFTVENFNRLLTWLGIRGCHYTAVLHSNKNGYEQDSSRVLEGKCIFEE